MLNFEKLTAWQMAIEFAGLVYDVTEQFPAHERYGLTSQMRRAAVSISSNIAEGSSRLSRAEFRHYIQIASGSVFEVVSQAAIARRQNFMSEEARRRIYAQSEEQTKVLSGLLRSLND